MDDGVHPPVREVFAVRPGGRGPSSSPDLAGFSSGQRATGPKRVGVCRLAPIARVPGDSLLRRGHLAAALARGEFREDLLRKKLD